MKLFPDVANGSLSDKQIILMMVVVMILGNAFT
jgi:hypothetical protein